MPVDASSDSDGLMRSWATLTRLTTAYPYWATALAIAFGWALSNCVGSPEPYWPPNAIHTRLTS